MQYGRNDEVHQLIGVQTRLHNGDAREGLARLVKTLGPRGDLQRQVENLVNDVYNQVKRSNPEAGLKELAQMLQRGRELPETMRGLRKSSPKQNELPETIRETLLRGLDSLDERQKTEAEEAREWVKSRPGEKWLEEYEDETVLTAAQQLGTRLQTLLPLL